MFDTETMTICSGQQYANLTTCAIRSNINILTPLMCFISSQTVSPTMYESMITSRYRETIMYTSDDIKRISSTVTIMDLSSTQTDYFIYSATTSLMTTSIILTANSTYYMNTVADTSSNRKNGTVTDHSTNAETYTTLKTQLILLNAKMYTSIVSTPMYNDNSVPFITNNITLILSISLVILLIISILSCGVIVVIVIIKRRKTHKTNNGK